MARLVGEAELAGTESGVGEVCGALFGAEFALLLGEVGRGRTGVGAFALGARHGGGVGGGVGGGGRGGRRLVGGGEGEF